MWIAEGVKERRNIDLAALAPVPSGVGYEILSLNRTYFEIQVGRDEAAGIVEEESQLIQRLEAAGDDWTAIVDLLDERYEDPDETSVLDAGISGAVAALASVGALPITSCNGGTLGDAHREEVPCVIFACRPNLVSAIEAAAAAAGCGLSTMTAILSYSPPICAR